MLQLNKTVTGTEPITLDEAKAWMRVDGATDDILITSLITQVRELVEEYLNISIVETTIKLTASERKELVLPYGPVIVISSCVDTDADPVSYDWNGFYMTFDQGTYSVTGGSSLYVQTLTTYDTGLTDVPGGLKLGMLEVLLWLYENRGDSSGFQMMLYQNQNLQPYRNNNVWI